MTHTLTESDSIPAPTGLSLRQRVGLFHHGKEPKSVTVFTSRRGLKVIFLSWRKTTPFMVRFPKAAGTQAGRRYYPTAESAQTAVAEYENGHTAVSLGRRQTDELLYVKALLGDTPLIEAVRFYLENRSQAEATMTLKELMTLLRTRIKKKSDKYRETTEWAIGRIEDGLGANTKVRDLSRPTLIRFIEKSGGGSYWNQLAVTKALSAAYYEGVRRGSLKINPLVRWRPEKPTKTSVEFMPMADVHALLDFVARVRDGVFLPAFALQFFCGIRTEELCREDNSRKRALDWSDFKADHIDIPVEVSKMNERRVIDFLPDALQSYLLGRRELKGRVMPFTTYGNIKARIVAEFQAERKEQGLPPIKWLQNAMRHTYASHAVGYFESADRVALLMGHHDASLLFSNYRGYVSKVEGEAYFNLKPTQQ